AAPAAPDQTTFIAVGKPRLRDRIAPTRSPVAPQTLGKAKRSEPTQAVPVEQTLSALSPDSSPLHEELGSPSPPESPDVPALDAALNDLGIFAASAALRHATEQAAIAAGSHLPILLLGETGTGKERFAHLIHRLSPRSQRDLIAINCAAIPTSIAESYLFGHAKGAFTGATDDTPGIFDPPPQGTLFLHEIAEPTLDVQAKLLRVIQEGAVQPLGRAVPRKLDVRIVAATNRDLKKEISAGRFREDLYFRLEVVQIKLPA